MTVEPTTSQDTAPTEPIRHRWADDGGSFTEIQPPEPAPTAPDASFEAGEAPTEAAAQTDRLGEAGTEAPVEASDSAGTRPLLTEAAEQDFLTRWAEIQVGFLEDPAQSVQDADGLIEEITTALLKSFQERRLDLAADWQNGGTGTEELRLALRRYRAFVGVLLSE